VFDEKISPHSVRRNDSKNKSFIQLRFFVSAHCATDRVATLHFARDDGSFFVESMDYKNSISEQSSVHPNLTVTRVPSKSEKNPNFHPV